MYSYICKRMGISKEKRIFRFLQMAVDGDEKQETFFNANT